MDDWKRIKTTLVPSTWCQQPPLARVKIFRKARPGFTPEWVKTFPARRRTGHQLHFDQQRGDADVGSKHRGVRAASLSALFAEDRNPMHVVFDLDPGEGANIFNCAEVALLLRDVSTKLRLRPLRKSPAAEGQHLQLDPVQRLDTANGQ
jgi:bifunctional non-homologous end joining protein LigD